MQNKIVFLSGLFPRELEEDIYSNSKRGVQNAANNLQWEFVKGLVYHTKGDLIVLNSLYIGSYPLRYRKAIINSSYFNIANNHIKGINIGFLNIPIIKEIYRYFGIRRQLNRTILKKENYVVIAYAMTNVMTKILKHLSKYKNIRTVLIIPDLPEYMNFTSNQPLFYRMLKNFSLKMAYKDVKFIDSFVFLTKYMIEKIHTADKRYTVIEGIYTSCEQIKRETHNNEIFTCFYSGGLNLSYGVKDLIESFEKITIQNIELVLCGQGHLSDYILEKCKNNKRIKFLGQIPHSQTVKMQKSVNLLINPRKNINDYTKYSFPSKILEYMASETPVLMYKLDGIPDEYYDKVFLIDNYESIEDAIEKIYFKSRTELLKVANLAKDFIINEKNNIVQTKKIIDLIADIFV